MQPNRAAQVVIRPAAARQSQGVHEMFEILAENRPTLYLGHAGAHLHVVECRAGCAYCLSMNDTPHPALSPDRPDGAEADLAPAGTPLHVAVAPGVLDKEHVVIRADDDTDEDYEAKQRLLDAMLAYAKQQG